MPNNYVSNFLTKIKLWLLIYLYNSLPNEFTKEFIITNFSKLTLSKLNLSTKVIKYKKPSVGCVYEIVTYLVNKKINLKYIRKKDNKTLINSNYEL